ncbi:MAG TPA: hypothetical protein VEH84_12300 [Alphaproteobacteria bacterium]|nr:hypothetical protein [Alphaproteobacteria bacterium]
MPLVERLGWVGLAATVIAFLVWVAWQIGADGGAIGGHGIAALVIGTLGSIVLGVGLMALVFYSSRAGYDR